MKFLLFSDSHNYTNGIDYAIARHPDICHIIHCGDVADDIEYLYHVYDKSHAICPVSGNNDFSAPYPLFRIVQCEGHKIYVAHGHKEHVKSSTYGIESAAISHGCDICIFGHTHTQFLEEKENIIILNPGSIGYFRQQYAVIDITKDAVKVTLCKI